MPRTGPRTPEGHKGARTPETPLEDEPPRHYKRDHAKRPSTPPEPYPTSSPLPIRDLKTSKSGPKSPVSMTTALERAYKQKGPRTPPPPMDMSPPDLDHKRRRTPPIEGYEMSPPPAKRRRSRERSPARDRRSKHSRDRYDRRSSRSPRRSRSPPPRSRGERGRRSPSRSPSRSRRSRRSSRDRYPPSPPPRSRDRDYRDQRDHGRDRGSTEAATNLQPTSLFTEMMKNKKAREMVKQKQQKRSDGSSVVVNSELSDPRSQPQPRLPPGQDHSREHGHRPAVPANGVPLNNRGPRPPPHRPGNLPMPPGK